MMNFEIFALNLLGLGLIQVCLVQKMQLAVAQGNKKLTDSESSQLSVAMNMANSFIFLSIILGISKTLQPKQLATLERYLSYFLPIPAIFVIVISVALFQSQNIPNAKLNAGSLIVLGLFVIAFGVHNIMHKKPNPSVSNSSASEDRSTI